jgi:type II secretory pathway pseudopilin PulG
MNLLFSTNQVVRRRRDQVAFTLTEVMVSSAVFLLLITGVIYSHIMGIRMYELTKAKLGASDMARNALSLMVTEVRCAKYLMVGSGSLTTFSNAPSGSLQQGSALQIYRGTNTNDFIRYYFDATDNKLRRTTNGATYKEVIAEFITNSIVFTSENYNGAVLTDNQNNRVIGLTLQFYQIQYPITIIGPGQYYDFYQLRTKITRRVLE